MTNLLVVVPHLIIIQLLQVTVQVIFELNLFGPIARVLLSPPCLLPCFLHFGFNDGQRSPLLRKDAILVRRGKG